MTQKVFKQVPKDLREWSRFFDIFELDTNNYGNESVSFVKIQSIATGMMLGRSSAGTGPIESIAQSLFLLASSRLTGSATYDPPNLADGAGVTTTVTVSGAAMGDFAIASFSADLTGMTVNAYVSAVNTVSVRFQNETGAGIDLASGTLRALVWKQ